MTVKLIDCEVAGIYTRAKALTGANTMNYPSGVQGEYY